MSKNSDAIKAAARPGWRVTPAGKGARLTCESIGLRVVISDDDDDAPGVGLYANGGWEEPMPFPLSTADMRELAAQLVAVADAIEPPSGIPLDKRLARLRELIATMEERGAECARLAADPQPWRHHSANERAADDFNRARDLVVLEACAIAGRVDDFDRLAASFRASTGLTLTR